MQKANMGFFNKNLHALTISGSFGFPEFSKGKEKGVRERAGEGSENKVTKGRDKKNPLICFFHASEKAKTKLP